jgi:hypothetical protein
MVTALTIKCDWRGCSATLTIPCQHDASQRQGWKLENYGLFSLHFCLEHRRHTWDEVRTRIFLKNESHSTGQHVPPS